MTTTISEDRNKYNEYLNKTLQGVDTDLMCQAMQRVKDYAYTNEIIGGELAFFLSGRTLKAIEAIKRERETIKEAERKEKLRQQKELQEEFTKPEELPPSIDGALAQPVRVATREELQNMLYALDKNYKFLFEQINGLNNALDVIQVNIKTLTDKMQIFEDIINMPSSDNTNNDRSTNTKRD